MYDDDLPEFQNRKKHLVMPLMTKIFSRKGESGNFLLALQQFPDGHFRAVFRSSYFVLTEGQAEPSKSQWNTLKKKLKRHDHQLFVFKDTGYVNCDSVKKNMPQNADFKCCYLDFGYFKYD